MVRVLESGVWKHITRLIERQPGHSHVAVAYLSGPIRNYGDVLFRFTRRLTTPWSQGFPAALSSLCA